MKGVKLVVVTGTNGKTTSTAFIAHFLNSAGVSAEAAGNIGRPLISLVERKQELQWAVVEASSFQLHDSPNLNPAVGVVTNLAPDHLDRYATIEEYYGDKKLIFANASERSVWMLNGDDQDVLDLASGVPGRRYTWSLSREADAWWDRGSDRIYVDGSRLIDRPSVPLLGDHNIANLLAAALAARSAGVGVDQLAAAIPNLKTPPHRLETVRRIRGTTWVNDSKATNVASTRVALQAMDAPFVLIAGGREKGESLDPLLPLLSGCRRAILYGEAAEKFNRALRGTVELEVVEKMEEAVGLAAGIAQDGEFVLLSPACASFDQFKNFEERGELFKRLVREIG